MGKLANLSSFVNVDWTDHGGHEHECQCEVGYSFDGDDELIIKTVHVVYGIGSDSYDFDELVYGAVWEVAPEAYAEWQCEYDDELIARAADAHWLGSGSMNAPLPSYVPVEHKLIFENASARSYLESSIRTALWELDHGLVKDATSTLMRALARAGK